MIIPVGFGLATYRYTGSGLPLGAANTLGFQNLGALTAQNCANLLLDAWVDNIMPVLSIFATVDDVLVKLGPNSTGPTAVASSGTAGTDAGTPTPPSFAALVRKVTNLGGREGRGRFFVPGIDEDEVDQAGNIFTAKVTALQTAFDAYEAELISNGLPPFILHTSATAPTPITQFVVMSLGATQRRRLRR